MSSIEELLAEYDPKKAAKELVWLKDHPHFDERPASIREFLGPEYLNIDALVRDGVREELVKIFGEESSGKRISKVSQAMFTGGIGIGKTTFASIALPYMVHWVLCLKDPQLYFDLLPGTRIAFMQMSTSEDQAKQVLFGDILARINHSRWFKNHPHDPAFKNQIRFEKDIWILPGDSAETTFEGYNILGGILDEMDSHRVTARKDYAQDGYNTIHARISSRFQDRGLLILIGQMKQSDGFAARMLKEFSEDPEAHVARMTIWESLGWKKFLKPDGTHDSFWYDRTRKMIVPELVAEVISRDHLMEIPNVYKKDFLNNPEKALRDLAGIPPMVGSAFISMTHKIHSARDRWIERFPDHGPPVSDRLSEPKFADWFRAPNSIPRAIHIDIAYSSDGDALGLAMGHIPELKAIDDELKPVVVFDFICRVRPLPGMQLILSDVRQWIYRLKDEFKYNIRKITMDGFQSTEMQQQLQKKRYYTDSLSIDKNLVPYHDLREALYEDRLEFPPYATYSGHGDTRLVEYAVKELSELIQEAKKVDHPPKGSKDVADAMAGVVHTLMGDTKYRRGLSSRVNNRPPAGTSPPGTSRFKVPGTGVSEYALPSVESLFRESGIDLPERLLPNRKRPL